MKSQHIPSQLTETLRDQFRTPRRPSPSGTSKALRSTISKRKRPASPSVSASGGPRKRSSLPSSRAQSTLTQIDFVTQTPHSDDDQLDYLDEAEPHEDANITNARAQIDGESDEDTDYLPPLRARSGPANFQANDKHPTKQRKSAGVNTRASERGQNIRKNMTPKPSISGKGKRKSTEKQPTKRNKTLTQMDFVRRYITIDDDDDVNMGYIQEEPRRDSTENGQRASSVENQAVRPRPPASAKRNRRVLEAELDLSTGEPLSGGLGDNQDTNPERDPEVAAAVDMPVTPQKPRKLEIPSSQSPESPGLAIITSSQFHSATRSPSKQIISNLAHHSKNTIKEESPGPRRTVEDSQDLGGTPLVKTSTQPSPRLFDRLKHHSSPIVPKEAVYAPSTESASQAGLPGDPGPKTEQIQRERTVVYETDADTDNSDSEDDMNDNPGTPSRAHGPHAEIQTPTRHTPEPSSDDSQELPLPNVQSSETPSDGPPSEAPMSDASIFYQRMQPATQFPFEPIPTLNTQKLSELFPNEVGTQYSKPVHSSPKVPGPFLQTQPQSQEADQTEIVPESSPVREQDENSAKPDTVFQRPQVPESVVQVESSQPVDRGNNRPGGILSHSQLLTSSVMESVPLPNFWIGSQESVGEPYSLPDR